MKKACLSCMGVLLTLTLVSGVILSSTHVSADPVTSTASANATVIVPSACTLTAVVNTAHSAEVPAGTYQADIGSTTFTTICNDAEGYSIYAVGNANNQYGNNKLLATISGSLAPTYDINTGTNTSGSPSSWAMKLTAAGSTSVPTIASDTGGSFSSYHTVPATNTKVVTYASATNQSTGSSFTATYAANIAGDQPAGTYNGKVKYTMVHPSTGTPNEPKDCTAGKICYWPNGDGEVPDTMGDQTVISWQSNPSLWASNFKRNGYGFAGWSETYDYSDETKFHGPNEIIDNQDTLDAIQSDGLSLYAIWVPSQDDMQDWSGCPALEEGEVTALRDQRDGNIYAVAKLADNKCWMIENLRLNNTATHNSDGTLAQGYGGMFAGLADSETENYSSVNPPVANSLYYAGTQSGAATINIGTNNTPYSRIPRYNNQNTTSPSPNMTAWNKNFNVYSIGNWYNWPATIADTNNYTANNQSINLTSICPSGWRLPIGGDKNNIANSDYWQLIVVKLNNNVLPANYDNSNQPYYTGSGEEKAIPRKLRAYPNNFILSGQTYNSSSDNQGVTGDYWSSTSTNYYRGYVMTISGSIYPGTQYLYKYNGGSVRCIAGS